MQVRRVDEVAIGAILELARRRCRAARKPKGLCEDEKESHGMHRYAQMVVQSHEIRIVAASGRAHGEIDSFGVACFAILDGN